MNRSKLYRNIWMFGGLCYLLFTVLNLVDNKSNVIIILDMIACIIFFINAYLHHNKINKNNKN